MGQYNFDTEMEEIFFGGGGGGLEGIIQLLSLGGVLNNK